MQEPKPRQWTRETTWRQGHVLPTYAAGHLGLSNQADNANTCVVVISHDCDLANDNLAVEPDVEVVVGRLVPNADGNFTWAKAPRTLHYAAERNGVPVCIELMATSKRSVKKVELAQFDPEASFTLDGKGLTVLRSWLGSRYNRAAFPDAFVNRMRSTRADSKLSKALEGHGELVSFVYFDLDEGQSVDRKDGDPYTLSIVLVFSPGDDAEAAADEADEVAEAVEQAIIGRLKDPKEIILKGCLAISEDDVTVSRARTLSHWRLEYMTLKSEDEQPGPPKL